MGERDDAKHQVRETRARMTAIAHEVSRRMTPEYAKERAREMARHKAMEVRDRAVENPWLGPLLGAGIGALVGRMFMTRVEERRDRARWDRGDGSWRERGSYGRDGYGYGAAGDVEVWSDEDVDANYEGSLRSGSAFEGESPGGLREKASAVGDKATEMKDRLTGKAGELGDRAADVKDRIAGKAGEVRDRMRERAGSIRSRIPDREAMRSNAQEQPAFWVLGAAAIGALFGFALPVSDKERQVLEPAKQKMREAGQQAMDKAVEKVEGRESHGGEEQHAREETSSSLITPPGATQTPDLH